VSLKGRGERKWRSRSLTLSYIEGCEVRQMENLFERLTCEVSENLFVPLEAGEVEVVECCLELER